MKVVLFGTGLFYELYKDCFSFFDVVALVDNDIRKQNTFIDGVKVFAPKMLKELDFDRVFLLIAPANMLEMETQLKALGVPSDRMSSVYDIRRYCDGNISERNLLQIHTNNYTDIINDKRKIRIVVFHPVRGVSINGVDTCLIQLCKALTKYAEVHVVLSQDCYLTKILLKYNVTVIIDELSHIKRLDDIPWKNGYDLIFINSTDMFNLLDGIEGSSKPIVWWLHAIGEALSQIPLSRLEFIRNANIHVYAVSPLTKLVFQKILPNWTIKSLLYGLNEDGRQIKKTLNEHKIIFAIVGRCSKGKGQDILVDAIRLLPNEIKAQCEFWIVGYMNNNRMYEKKIMKGIKSENCIKALGPLYDDDLKQMYNQIDVLLCPSRADAMPIVCAEAMMHYHPCIVSENVGTKFLIKDKENGLICKTEDPFDLKNKIEWCVNNRDKIIQMGKKARSIYENNFTMSKFEENVISILKELGI